MLSLFIRNHAASVLLRSWCKRQNTGWRETSDFQRAAPTSCAVSQYKSLKDEKHNLQDAHTVQKQLDALST